MPRRARSLSADQKRKKKRDEMRSRRSDPQVREPEKARDAVARTRSRSNPQIRELEKERDAMARVRSRANPLVREPERERFTIAQATRRSNRQVRSPERQRDANARAGKRLNPLVRSPERQRDATARRGKRNAVTWESLCENYFENVKQGPTYSCCSCDRLFFKKSIKTVTKEKLIERGCTEEFLDSVILDRYIGEPDLPFCTTCHQDIAGKKHKAPKLNIKNSNLQFPDLDPKITDLSALERRLVSPRIPFMKIFALGCDQQYGIRGGIVNVPVDVPKMFSTIPINPDQAGVIHLKLKRKTSYQSHYLYERIRPKSVFEAAQVLAGSPLYTEEGITLNSTWELQNQDTALFNADSTEDPMDCDETPIASTSEESSDKAADEADDNHEQLCEETLIDSNHAVDFAPGEGQIPMSILYDEHCEELAFPSIFGGYAREPNPDIKLSYTDIVNSEIRRTDRRAVEPEHLLYVHKKSQLQQLGSLINIQIKKSAQSGMTAANARDKTYINEVIKQDNAFRFLGQITGSPAYWEQQKKNVMAMVRQLGIPTFFVTLSAAETQWKDLHRILFKTANGRAATEEEIDNLSFAQKADLIRNDPVTCALYFEHRFKEVKKTWVNTEEGPFGKYKVKHMYYRIEFQHRGSPHVHMLLWLEGAPVFNADDMSNLDEIAAFIDSIVTTNSQDEEVKEFTQYQKHRCSRTCHKTQRGRTQCRFGAPFPPMEKTMILTPLTEELSKEDAKKNREFIKTMNELLDAGTVDNYQDFLSQMGCDEDSYIKILRSQLKANKIFVKRTVKDCRVNAFSKKILMLMQSNIDVQFILDPFACVSYIVDYISKPSRGISKLLFNCYQNLKDGNHSIAHQLRCVGNCFYNGCEISAQECAWCRLRLAMSSCSVYVEFVNTSLSKNRHRILKSAAELKKLPADSTDIFKPGPIERYVSRPVEMEDVCLADFIACYNFKGKGRQQSADNDEEDNHIEDANEDVDDEVVLVDGKPKKVQLKDGTLTLRKNPKVLRYCRFDIHKDRANFFRERIMLFKPWRNETSDIENIHHEQVYQQHKELIVENSKKYIVVDIDIDSILEELMQRQDDEELETMEDHANPNFVNVYDYDEDAVRPNIMIDLGHEIPAVESKKYSVPDMYDDDDFFELADSLNDKQRDYLMHIISCFKNNKPNEVPTYNFISGGAGVGKSRLIQATYQSLTRWFRRDSGEAGYPEILIVACTGKAAHNVGGMTAHHAFNLPMVDRATSETFKGLGPEILNTCRVKLSKLKLIIIDEISMMSAGMFEKIHLRLNQIFGNNDSRKIFGGLSVIAFGDFQQLPPVSSGDFVFMPSKKNVLSQIVGPALWQKFNMFELTEIMRQKDDKVFAEALNRLAQGNLTQEDIDMFKTRCYTNGSLPAEGKSAIRLIYSNKEVDHYNNNRAQLLKSQNSQLMYVVSKAKDVVTGATNEWERTHALTNLDGLPPSKTQGLPTTLILQESMHYMVTSNISVEDGLFNGATGVLRYIIFNQEQQPVTVFIEFDDPTIGKQTRASHKNFIEKYPDIKSTWTPIVKTKLSFTTTQKRHLKVLRNQFPLVIAEAITIHKSQGSSYKRVTVQLPDINIRPLIYVALSRATSLNGLYLVGKFKPTSPPEDDHKVTVEMNRLRKEAVLEPKFVQLRIVPENCLQLVSHNVRSLHRHISSVRKDSVFIASHMLLLQETWLKISDTDESIDIPGKSVIARNTLAEAKGKGTIIYGNNLENIYMNESFDRTCFCNIDMTVCQCNDIYIINMYKSKGADADQIKCALSNVKEYLRKDNILICGDFNVDLKTSSPLAQLLQSLDLHLLSPLQSTTDHGTVIDGVFGRLTDYNCDIRIYESYFSDHKPLVIRLTKKFQNTGLSQPFKSLAFK